MVSGDVEYVVSIVVKEVPVVIELVVKDISWSVQNIDLSLVFSHSHLNLLTWRRVAKIDYSINKINK